MLKDNLAGSRELSGFQLHIEFTSNSKFISKNASCKDSVSVRAINFNKPPTEKLIDRDAKNHKDHSTCPSCRQQ